MSIDPVAVYAAVVATAALGWQVYQWKFDRKGSLEVGVSAWAWTDESVLRAVIANGNDYPVRIVTVIVTIRPSEEMVQSGFAAELDPWKLSQAFVPEQASIPENLPAHDSVAIYWQREELHDRLPGLLFHPDTTITFGVHTSLGGSFSASALIIGKSPPWLSIPS